jgi:O-antigen/teichoic acid export membrane protein
MDILRKIMLIQVFGLMVFPINTLNEKFFNAEMRFSIPYMLSLLPAFFTVLFQGIILSGISKDISLLAWGYSMGSILSTVIGIYLVVKAGIKLKLILSHNQFIPYIKNSFNIRMSCNINNIVTPTITNNILALFPAGYISYFYYAKKMLDVINAITIGPSSKILLSKLSKYWVENEIGNIKAIVNRFIGKSIFFFLAAILINYLASPIFLKIVSMGKLTNSDITSILFLFISLSIWYLILLIESPYFYMCSILRNSRIFIASNILLVLSYLLLTLFLKKYMGIYSLPAGIAVSQVVNLYIFRRYTRMKIRQKEYKPSDKEGLKKIAYL